MENYDSHGKLHFQLITAEISKNLKAYMALLSFVQFGMATTKCFISRFTGRELNGEYIITSIDGIYAEPGQLWQVLGGVTNFTIITEPPNKWNPTSGERVLFKRVVFFADLDDSEDADQGRVQWESISRFVVN